ncbi:MAG: agmatinase [Simkaniaceae bacterium]|nr:agmatinase [Simkaniaceae bacterium]MCF7852213.1 agmatinase [Simkaniaceae bacterium]
MQGHGEEGHFLGIKCPLDEAKIVILPVAFDKTTTYGHGSDQGPAAMIEASRNLETYDIETDSEVYREGIYTAETVAFDTSEEMIASTYCAVSDYISDGKFVITLGGEHAISQAPIRANAQKYGSISVLQIDAHADLAFAYEGNPLSHASVMARVKEIPEVSSVVSVGIRSMSIEESTQVVPEKMFFSHQLFENDEWMDRVVEQLSDQVYITFDLDAFDASIMPSTGTPEPGGMTWHMATQLLKKVAEKRQIIGFDVVELAPIAMLPAPNFLAAKLIYKMLSYTFAINTVNIAR